MVHEAREANKGLSPEIQFSRVLDPSATSRVILWEPDLKDFRCFIAGSSDGFVMNQLLGSDPATTLYN